MLGFSAGPVRRARAGRLAQLVRALRSHRRGHRFESCAAHSWPGFLRKPTPCDARENPRPLFLWAAGFLLSGAWPARALSRHRGTPCRPIWLRPIGARMPIARGGRSTRRAALSACSPLLRWLQRSAACVGIERLRKGRKNRCDRLQRQPFSWACAALGAPEAAAKSAPPTPDPFRS